MIFIVICKLHNICFLSWTMNVLSDTVLQKEINSGPQKEIIDKRAVFKG